jgi:solute carrier family 25 (mitochondrial S-adenosylmethionine transporter), member 26
LLMYLISHYLLIVYIYISCTTGVGSLGLKTKGRYAPFGKSRLYSHFSHHYKLHENLSAAVCASLIAVLLSPSPAWPTTAIQLRETPIEVLDIMKERYAQLRAGVTGEKTNELLVGSSLVERLRNFELELDNLQKDLYKDDVDWEVIRTYPKSFRAYTSLYTAYTDRAFPSSSDVDVALRYALRYEVANVFNGVKSLEDAAAVERQRSAQRAFAEISLAYDHYLKAGDLYTTYEEANCEILEGGVTVPECWTYKETLLNYDRIPSESYIAPGIESPGINDEVVVLKGPDKGRTGTVLWISKGATLDNSNVIIKLDLDTSHQEIRIYPYQFLAKSTPPTGVFVDNLIAAYLASAVSSGIMYPIDSYKTRMQAGKSGVPSVNEGGIFKLWKGVGYFIADANDAVYVAIYGFLKPALLLLVDPNNPAAVFSILVLAGSLGDAVGSVFRVPSELVYKQIQTEAASSATEAFKLIGKNGNVVRFVIISWAAVLLRDMPFAGLQIALYDVYKTIFAFLDEKGWTSFSQQLLWGALAGGTAAYLTTPFDLLTTNIMIEAQSISNSSSLDQRSPDISEYKESLQSLNEDYTGIGQLFLSKTKEVIDRDGFLGLFTGAIERVLFFAPAGMIFFSCYETFVEILSQARNGEAFWQR